MSIDTLHARVVWKDAFRAVGEKIRFDPSEGAAPSENAISRLWQRFGERVGDIEHVSGGGYGFNLCEPGFTPGAPFDYLAAVGVSAEGRVPEGMEAISFPAGLYCVVTRQGVIDEIGAAYRYYWDTWLPQSGYRDRCGAASFEFYDDRYRGNHDPASIMELWFPIEPDQELPLENRVASAFVHVTDLRRSADWYSRLFGIPVMEERLNGGPVYWFDFAGTHLILDTNEGNRNDESWREDMAPRLMLAARDIDEAHRYAKERGAQPFTEPQRHGPMAYFNFRDPEGNALMACWTAVPGPDVEYPQTGPIRPGIGGVFVDVKNMRETARWYSELLGLPFEEANAERSVYALPVSRGAAFLLDRNRYANGEGFTERFYVRTDDLDAALAYAREHRFELAGEPQRFSDLSEFALLDPDGNRIVVACMK